MSPSCVFVSQTSVISFMISSSPSASMWSESEASEMQSLPSYIKHLYDWRFYVDFIIQDGGQENRQFIKSNLTLFN